MPQVTKAELHCFVLGGVGSFATVHTVPETPSGTCVLHVVNHPGGQLAFLRQLGVCSLAACHPQLAGLCQGWSSWQAQTALWKDVGRLYPLGIVIMPWALSNLIKILSLTGELNRIFLE